jgi:hypothetical protein
MGVASGCGTPPPRSKVLLEERIPIAVQKDKPTLFEVRMRGKSRRLGIQCAPELWQTLTNGGVDQIMIQLVSSPKMDTKLHWVRPGWRGMTEFTNTLFLCNIYGKRRGTATVQITFPDGPDEPSPAAIIVSKRSDQFKLRGILGYW